MAIINISGTIVSSFQTSGVLVNAEQAAGDAVFTIDLRPTNPKIIVQDNLDYNVLGGNINDVVATIIMIGPEGEIYRNEDFDNPDIVPATSRYLNKTITLPLDPLTNYTNILKGNYTLKVSWYNAVLDEYYNFLKTYQYDLTPPTIKNTTVSGPYTGILKSTDTTVYGNDVYQIIREHRVQYPDEMDPQPADVVSSNVEVQITPIYTNEWNILINSFVEYRQSDSLRIYWEGTGGFTHCVYGGCIGAMYEAIETMLETYTEELACNLVSKEQYQHRLVTLNTAWHLLNEAYWSGDAEEADQQAYIIQEQVAYTGSGTCGGATSEEVIPCPVWTGGGTGGTYTFQNGLTEGGGVVEFGGSLVEETSILAGVNQLSFSGISDNNTFEFNLGAGIGAQQIKKSDSSYRGSVEVEASHVGLKYEDIATPANNITYQVGATGIVETVDYASVYTNRTLVAKSYVDNLVAGLSGYTFENGLTESAGTVKLGGALTGNTIVSTGIYSFKVETSGSLPNGYVIVDPDHYVIAGSKRSNGYGSDIAVYGTYIYIGVTDDSGNQTNITMDTTSTVLSDNIAAKGLEYNADYSANWTDHSLITKKWVIDNFSAGASTFVAMTDTPTSYTGFGGYFVRVKSTADGLEFVTGSWVPSTGGTFTGQVIIHTSTDRPLILRQTGAGSTVGVPEGGINYVAFQDNDGDEQGSVGIDGSGNVILKSWVTGAGVVADGNLLVNGTVTANKVEVADNQYIAAGSGNDFRMWYSGATAILYVYDHGANLNIYGENAAGTQMIMATFDPDGGATLNHEGSPKFYTTSTGVEVIDDLHVNGTGWFEGGIYIGDLQPIRFYDSAISDVACTIYQSADNFFTFRNIYNEYTLQSLRSKVGDPLVDDREATLAFVRTDDAGNEEFFDIYNNGYHSVGDVNHGIMIQKRGTGQFRDFTFAKSDGTNPVQEIMRVDTTNNRIGILNVAPSHTFDVTGEGRFTGDLYVDTNQVVSGDVNFTGLSEVTSTSYVVGIDTTTGKLSYRTVAYHIPYGIKQTGTDAGILGELSIDDDYMYICVIEGGATVAVWKKIALSQT